MSAVGSSQVNIHLQDIQAAKEPIKGRAAENATTDKKVRLLEGTLLQTDGMGTQTYINSTLRIYSNAPRKSCCTGSLEKIGNGIVFLIKYVVLPGVGAAIATRYVSKC